MEQELNINGYDLYEIQDNVWIVHVKGGHIYYGTFSDTVKYLITCLYFDADQIDIAVQEMMKSSHNAAHFGMGRMFIYTFSKGFPDVTLKAS